MKTKYIFFILFVIALGTFLISCRKNIEETTVDPSNNFGLGEISKDFSWKTSDNIAFSIGMNIPSAGNALCRINIYSQDQAGMTTKMYSGSVNNGKTILTSVTIPSAMRMVSLELLQPDGSSKIETLPVTSAVNYTFTDSGLKGTTGFTDTDSDGIADLIDDYPSDRGKAFHFAFPNGSGNTKSTLSPVYWGTWCFEDLWPSMGDFDMNDLVINYHWEVTTDANHFVQTITGHFKVKAAGSCEAWRHGVGIVLNGVPANQVQTVTGYSLETGSYIQLNAKGIEPDAAGNNAKPAVVIPFDNFDNVIQNPTSGFFNTLSAIPCGTSTEQEMLITLVNPTTVTDAAIIIGNFDPFMIRNRTRNFEIHRADYPPTSYADLSNFGKGDDNSRPSEGKWYRTHENLPWALDIPVDFNYPAEYISIVDAYPEFKGWAQSGGTANQAWYNNPNTQPGLIFSCESSGNSAPLATTVGQTGTAAVGQTMTGGYTYSDIDGDLEGNSIFKWYRSDDSNGTNEAQITGVSGKTYLLQAADANKYIRFSVTPMAQTGTTLGHEVKASGYAGPVTSASANCGSPFTDSRDGKTYNTVLIGNQCWMKENLNIGTMINGTQGQTNNGVIEKHCYNNLESNCGIYGGLYQWNEIMQYVTTEGTTGLCPAGWHIPTDSEWTTLITNLGGTAVAGGKMKETGTTHWNSPNNATNKSGFTALPGGYNNGGFNYMGTFGLFWSSSEYTPDFVLRLITSNANDYVSFAADTKSSIYSGRCLKGDPIPVPTLTTENVTNINQISASSGGNITNDGGSPVNARGVCWSNTVGVPTISDPHTIDGSGTGNFTSDITGLTAHTGYFLRAYATNGSGTAYGNVVAFWTLKGNVLPTLTTTSVTNIAQTTATSGGDVTSDGGASVTARGVCWSTSQNPTISNSHTTDGNGPGVFVSNLTGLIQNTLYYVRAYATNSEGTNYGDEVNFTTTVSSGGEPCPGTPTVLYVGKTYHTVQIGTQCWIKENLNIGTKIPGSQEQANNGIIEKYCYNNDEANCAIYGGLYQWNEMMQYVTTPGVKGICPTGWHIPTDGEWTTFITILGGESVAGGKMKSTGTIQAGAGMWYSPNTGATNESGFTAVPAAARNLDGTFYGIGFYGYWWSSSEDLTAYAWGPRLYYDDSDVGRAPGDESGGFSVRCLLD